MLPVAAAAAEEEQSEEAGGERLMGRARAKKNRIHSEIGMAFSWSVGGIPVW